MGYFDGREHSMVDNYWWEDVFRCKMTSGERPPLMEDNLSWKKTLDDREPLIDDGERH